MQIYIILLILLWISYITYIVKQKNKLYQQLYFQLFLTPTIMIVPLMTAIEGAKIGELSIYYPVGIVFISLLVMLFGYRSNKHKYYINTVKKEKLINIITNYLGKNKIKFEVEKSELPAIHLIDLNKKISFFGYKTICIDMKEIKDLNIYYGLITEISNRVNNLD